MGHLLDMLDRFDSATIKGGRLIIGDGEALAVVSLGLFEGRADDGVTDEMGKGLHRYLQMPLASFVMLVVL
jgi:hypothetical protein